MAAFSDVALPLLLLRQARPSITAVAAARGFEALWRDPWRAPEEARKEGPLRARRLRRPLRDVVRVIEDARRAAARSVNAAMTTTYWFVGRRIVEKEQHGSRRAAYGKQLIKRLAHDLSKALRSRVLGAEPRTDAGLLSGLANFADSVCRNLGQGPLSGRRRPISQTVSAKLAGAVEPRFPLPWSHYVRLMAVDNRYARAFYETETLRGGWSIRQLDRQIDSQFYERTALSRQQGGHAYERGAPRPEDHLMPEEELKDPYVLEFLDLKDEYSESEAEDALIRHLETFLLELGGDFAFGAASAGSASAMPGIGWTSSSSHWRLRCLIVVDLKLGKFMPADAGQMASLPELRARALGHAGRKPASRAHPVREEGRGRWLTTRSRTSPTGFSLRNNRTTLPEEAALVAEMERTEKLLRERKRLPKGADAGCRRAPPEDEARTLSRLHSWWAVA